MRHEAYIIELKNQLNILHDEILVGRVHYVVFGHGADSHEWDELASQLTTEEWIECSKIVYKMILNLEQETGKSIPLIIFLEGGYRRDDYNSVLSLHTSDLVQCINILCNQHPQYTTEVKSRIIKNE